MTRPGHIQRRGARRGAHHLRAQAGFTLIEVLIAISIMAVITGVMWISINSMFETRDYMGERFERYQIMRVAMNRMARELSSAYLAGPAFGGEPLPDEPKETSERDPDDEPQRSLTQSRANQPVQFGMIGTDTTLNFTAFAHIRTLAGEPTSQHAEIGYFTKRVRGDDGKMVNALMRREDTTLDDDITKGGHTYMMIPEVEKVRFEYWDAGPVEVGTQKEMVKAGRWVDRWDTTRREFSGRLPTRVRIQVTLPAMNQRSRMEVFTIQTELSSTEVLEP